MAGAPRLAPGVAWTGSASAARAALQLATAVVLARLLTPHDFGLVAMVLVLTNFLALFGEAGLSSALIQRAELSEGHRCSTFWLTLALGGAVACCMALGAPWVAAFYGEPRLAEVALWLAPGSVLGSLGVVQRALLIREMRFRELGLVEIGATLGGGAFGIALALGGFGVWSLVGQLLATGGAEALGFWLFAGWRPRLHFDRKAMGELVPFSAGLLGYAVVNYWVRNLDSLLLGRFVGSAGLGLYDRAYRSMLQPLTHASRVTSRVLFPALSQLQADPTAVKETYLRALRVTSLVTFPLCVGMFVVADGFVPTLFGPQWQAAVPVLRVLCIVGLLQSVSGTTGWLYQSQGRTGALLRWGLFSGAVTLVAFGIGIRWGVMGIATAYAIRTVLLTLPAFAIPGRFVGMRLGEVAGALAGTLAAALAMGALVSLAGALLPVALPGAASFAIRVLVGVASYGLIVHASGLGAYREVLRALRRVESPATA